MRKIGKIVFLMIFIGICFFIMTEGINAVAGIPESLKKMGRDGITQIAEMFNKPAGIMKNNNQNGMVEAPLDLLVLVNKSRYLDTDFVPPDLVKVNAACADGVTNEERMMRREAASALQSMFSAAKKDGMGLYIVSGYRSYNTQEEIYSRGIRTNGEEYTEKYVARPGQSEHQTGLAMDVGSSNSKSQDFSLTREAKWIRDNAHEYGFILRYPQGKEDVTGYSYEPWHIRYVGLDAAKIKSSALALEEYLE